MTLPEKLSIRLNDHRPTTCGFCADEGREGEVFRNWAALRRHVVRVHILPGKR